MGIVLHGPRVLLLGLGAALASPAVGEGADFDALQTVAERSDYRATALYDDVVALMREIDARSGVARMISIGRTVEGRPIPVMILSNPPLSTPEEARQSGKLRLFAFGNIHAGEVCGKEALLRLAREIALEPNSPANRALLDKAVLLLAPIYNADGNERVSVDNRPGQVGPEQGMGERANAQGLDLNRDYVKLESPEARAMVGFLTAWDPHVVIDTHTTNGSFHQFTMTFEAPLNPSGHPAPIDFARRAYLPEVARRVEAATGYRSFFYGNFDRERTGWYTYDARPRFGGPYVGLRNRIGVLTEAYAYATYKDRVLATHAWVRECFALAAERAEAIHDLIRRADAETTAAGERAAFDDAFGLRHEFAAWDETVVIPGFVEVEDEHGRSKSTGEPLDRTVRHFGRFTPTRSVRRPLGYLIPPEQTRVIEQLRRHGVRLEHVLDNASMTVERAKVTDIQRSEREFQGHRNLLVDVERRRDSFSPPPGWWRVSTGQPLGNLVVYLLEPDSADGLVVWNYFDEVLAVGEDYPILRVVPEGR